MKTKSVPAKDVANNPNLSLLAEDYLGKPYSQMSDAEKIEALEATLIDTVEPNSAWYEIQEHTGLSEGRCKEIEALYREVLNEYNLRHKING